MGWRSIFFWFLCPRLLIASFVIYEDLIKKIIACSLDYLRAKIKKMLYIMIAFNICRVKQVILYCISMINGVWVVI